jgi:hypothetical protein
MRQCLVKIPDVEVTSRYFSKLRNVALHFIQGIQESSLLVVMNLLNPNGNPSEDGLRELPDKYLILDERLRRFHPATWIELP